NLLSLYSSSCALVFLLLQCSRTVTDAPTGPGPWLCHEAPKCEDKIYNPLEQCCHDDTTLPLNRNNLYGPKCTFWPCFELCCPESFEEKYVINLKVLGVNAQCYSSPISGDCPWLQNGGGGGERERRQGVWVSRPLPSRKPCPLNIQQ
uniref:IGF like family member 3 n=1 Tax=Ursus maritimus TaxID=29073 RepID=A0A452VGQ5_URSMA